MSLCEWTPAYRLWPGLTRALHGPALSATPANCLNLALALGGLPLTLGSGSIPKGLTLFLGSDPVLEGLASLPRSGSLPAI